jgi:class 3 adenylate cyclase/streptogramin lyase
VSELPTGTVSLLFTDIEGSTQLQHRLGERYQEVVAEHRRLLEDAFTAHGGTVVDRQTESFFVVFPRVRLAVHAAAAAQVALADHTWPDGVQVKVRMGIHAGDPEVAGDRYVGLAVSRAARICASAHGGQVLLSSSARGLLSDDQRSDLRSLGAYRLKDFAGPEPISQLVIDGLPSQFPPLRTEAKPGPRKRLVFAAAALFATLVTAVAVIALTAGGSNSIEVGPTSLAVIDPDENKVVDAIDLGFTSNLIAAGEGFVWVADPQGNTLVKIDPESRAIVKRVGISVGAGVVPFGLAAGGGAVWLAVFRGTKPVVLEFGPDVVDLRRAIPYGGNVPSPVLFRFQPLAVGRDVVWALDPAVGGLWRIDLRTERAAKVDEGLEALSLAADAAVVWLAGPHGVTTIDAGTGLELGSTSIGSPEVAETASIALGRSGAWYTASSGRTLSKLDPQSTAVTSTFSVGRGPSGVAVGEGAVWVANSLDGTVSRVDESGAPARRIRVGHSPGGIAAEYGGVWTSPGEPLG